MNATLIKFLNKNWKNTHEKKMDSILVEWQQRREKRCKINMRRERVLSYAFWYYVYNNDKLTKNECVRALVIESNGLMRRLYQDREHRNAIDSLYDEYLAFFNKSNRNAIWYLFWHDVWKKNGHNVKNISQNGNIFNTNIHFQNELKRQQQEQELELQQYNVGESSDTIASEQSGRKNKFNKCLALNYQNKKQLIEILDELKLHGKRRIFIRNGWFNDEIIDKLYQLLDWADKNLDAYDTKFDNIQDSKDEENIGDEKRIENDNSRQFTINYMRASTLIRTIFDVANQSDLMPRQSVASIHRQKNESYMEGS